ncbi:SNF2 family N-terminal domain-containing protein [Daldinia sp. FL1419]|nr:SNF2 family N-terminal domain-containing protein [Daldinia sp. FL1419]
MPPLSQSENASNRQGWRSEPLIPTSISQSINAAQPGSFDQENSQPTPDGRSFVDKARQDGEARTLRIAQPEQQSALEGEKAETLPQQEQLKRQQQEPSHQDQDQGRANRQKMNPAKFAGNILPEIGSGFKTARDMYEEFQLSAHDFDYVQSQQSQPFPPLYSQPHGKYLPFAGLPPPAASRRLNPRRDDDSDDDDDDDGGSDNSIGRGRNAYLNFAKPDETQKEIQNLLTMPEIDIPPEQRKGTPAAMSCTLMEHQKVCLTWLVQQEEDVHKKGGILADTMGLGKTIQALALILAHPSRDRSRKTTLIIAPLSLLKQWEREILSKVKPAHRLKTIILHGQAKHAMTVPVLLTYDVVLTTYGTVTSEHKALKDKRKKPVILGHNAIFHRVILDEAHSIKNRRAKSSVAVSKIKSTYRLCMTGTPFMNNAEEIFPLIRFLRIRPYDEWETFKWEISKPLKSWNNDFHDSGMRKLQALFRSITLRRTKTSVLDGKPIIQLPRLVKAETFTIFNKDQREFYDALEQKQQLKVNNFIRTGTVMQKYSYILVLLLRLRQACCHPHLIRDFGIPEDIPLSSDDMRQLARRLKRNIVGRLKAQDDFVCPVCNETTKSPLIMYPCGHPICTTCFSVMMEMRDPNSEQQSSCPYHECNSDLSPEKIICYFSFLEAHMPEKLGLDDSDDSDDDSDGFESLDDSEDDVDARGNLKGFIVSEDEDDEEEEDDDEEEEGDDEDDEDEYEGDEEEEGGEKEQEEKEKEEEEQKEEEGSDKDHNSTSEDIKPLQYLTSTDELWKDVSANKESPEEKLTDDSDNDSLMSLKEIWRRVEKMRHIAKDEPEQSNKREVPSDSTSDINADEKKVSRTRDKRKRPSRENPTRSKKTKTSGGASKKGRRGLDNKFTSLAALKKASSTNAVAKAKYLKRLRKDWVPSAKIDKTMEILCAIRDRDPKEKTLVFSLWTSFLDLLEIPIHDQGFNYTRYDGAMQHGDRDAAAKNFMNNPGVQIMLVSLSAGNAGLNLTAATQVIILEPFWNPFVEEQAVDRAHRIGQKKEVTVHRIVIDGTVEDRIRELQEKKRNLVSAALSEEGARGAGRLSLSELRGLFGLR